MKLNFNLIEIFSMLEIEEARENAGFFWKILSQKLAEISRKAMFIKIIVLQLLNYS